MQPENELENTLEQDVAVEEPTTPLETAGPKRILIVEDNALNMRLFNDLLEAHGHMPICEQNAENVLETALAAPPDLILMDIQLPELSGFDLIKLVKAQEKLAHIPVIAITAFAMSGDEAKIMDAGFADYISKPISVMGFLETVQKHL